MYSRCSFCKRYEVDMFCEIYPDTIPKEIYFFGSEEVKGIECDKFIPRTVEKHPRNEEY